MVSICPCSFSGASHVPFLYFIKLIFFLISDVYSCTIQNKNNNSVDVACLLKNDDLIKMNCCHVDWLVHSTTSSSCCSSGSGNSRCGGSSSNSSSRSSSGSSSTCSRSNSI